MKRYSTLTCLCVFACVSHSFAQAPSVPSKPPAVATPMIRDLEGIWLFDITGDDERIRQAGAVTFRAGKSNLPFLTVALGETGELVATWKMISGDKETYPLKKGTGSVLSGAISNSKSDAEKLTLTLQRNELPTGATFRSTSLNGEWVRDERLWIIKNGQFTAGPDLGGGMTGIPFATHKQSITFTTTEGNFALYPIFAMDAKTKAYAVTELRGTLLDPRANPQTPTTVRIVRRKE